jgi:hypothetical protein
LGNASIWCYCLVMAWNYNHDSRLSFWSFCSNTARFACCEQVSMIRILTAIVVWIFWGRNGVLIRSKVKKFYWVSSCYRLQAIYFGSLFGSSSKKSAFNR